MNAPWSGLPTPETDAMRTDDYILTRNDCLIGMDRYRDKARSLEQRYGYALGLLEGVLDDEEGDLDFVKWKLRRDLAALKGTKGERG